jgi:hypothetical protein
MLRSGHRATGLILVAVLLGATAGIASCSESSPLYASKIPRDLSSGTGGAATTGSAHGGGGNEPTTCHNEKQDADETDTDCGGSCSKKCADGQGCTAEEGTDCESGVCIGNVCQKPTCTDKFTNGQEEDVDCGGACSPCGLGKQCTKGADCIGGVCDTSGVGSSKGVCAPSCSDLVQNQDEAGIDCGGSCPLKCNGEGCTGNNNCKSTACGGGLCRLPNGAPCVEDAECASIRCTDAGGGAKGCAACAVGTDCKSNLCDSGICKIESGAPCGNNADCVGGSCISYLCVVTAPLACKVNNDCSTYHCGASNKCAICTSGGNECDGLEGSSNQCDTTTANCFLPAGAYCSPQLKQCLPGLTCTGFPPKCQ